MNWFSELQRLDPLQSDLALLPVGWGADRKGPMLKDWPAHPGFTTEQLQQCNGIRSIGARTGLLTVPLLAFDFDGQSSIELGFYPWAVTTWQVHRDNDPWRLKALFQPTPSQVDQLPKQADGSLEFQGKTNTKEKQGDAKGEALEVFFDGGRQVIILGEHPASGGNYFWPEGLGPEALSAPPDDWWQHAIERATQFRDRNAGSKSSTTRKGTRRLNPCPTCGRHSGKGGSALWCEETTNGLILCMPGSTFSAEQKHGQLSIGQVVNGYALVKKSVIPEGDVFTFSIDKPRRQPNAAGPVSRRAWGRC